MPLPPEFDDLSNAFEALQALSAKLAGFHPEHPLATAAAEMRLTLELTRNYIADYLVNQARGAQPEDALMAVLRGDTKLPQETVAALIAEARKGMH